MYIRHIYIPLGKDSNKRKGLSERIIRRRLEKKGWTVWRGGSLNIIRKDDVFPNVKRKYSILNNIMDNKTLEMLQYLCEVHHGMPDLLCYRDHLKFVECKLGHEQLSERQKICMGRLKDMGFEVEVHKLVFDCTKTRESYNNPFTGEKIITDKQDRLRLNYSHPKV